MSITNTSRNHENLGKLISSFPSLQGKLRSGNVEFLPFDGEVADRLCASSYVIPFVSDTNCLITRRTNGKWVLPGGTLEPGENWVEAAKRELMEETGSHLGPIYPVGMYHCFSQEEYPRRPHLPHPKSVRVVSWANAEQVKRPFDPDIRSTIIEVRIVHFKEAGYLFDSDTPDFGDLYQLAYHVKQVQDSL